MPHCNSLTVNDIHTLRFASFYYNHYTLFSGRGPRVSEGCQMGDLTTGGRIRTCDLLDQAPRTCALDHHRSGLSCYKKKLAKNVWVEHRSASSQPSTVYTDAFSQCRLVLSGKPKQRWITKIWASY